MEKNKGETGSALPRTFAEHDAKVARTRTMRYVALVLYFTAVIVVTALPFSFEMTDVQIGILNLGVVVGGAVALIAFILYPFFRPARGPEVPDDALSDVVDTGAASLDRPWHESVPMTMLYYISAFILVLYVAFYVFYRDSETAVGLVVALLIIAVLVAVFGRLDVNCTPEALSFRYGPAGRTIPVGNIRSIRPTEIVPMKDFMGWGVRVGPDGSVGYISSGRVGVRIHVGDGRKYVITVKDPQGLVNYVRAARKVAGEAGAGDGRREKRGGRRTGGRGVGE